MIGIGLTDYSVVGVYAALTAVIAWAAARRQKGAAGVAFCWLYPGIPAWWCGAFCFRSHAADRAAGRRVLPAANDGAAARTLSSADSVCKKQPE